MNDHDINTEPYAEITHIDSRDGTMIIDFKIEGHGTDHPVIDFDLSSIGRIDPRNWGDENKFGTGWVAVERDDLINIPVVGDVFFLDKRGERQPETSTHGQ